VKRLGVALFLLVVLSSAGWAFGQARQPRPSRAPGEDAFKMVKAYILSNLQERLDLTDQQYEKLFPLVNRLYDNRHKLARKKGETLREMSRLLRRGQATEEQLEALVKELKEVEAEERATATRDEAAIDAVLDPVQQAKIRVYRLEVERRIRELAGRRRQGGVERRNQPQRPPRPQ
jgi:Spy/CpxP family protein refolding chaperone